MTAAPIRSRAGGSTVLAHLTAAGIAMTHARLVSRSGFVQTGLQFVAPLLLILLCHLARLALGAGLATGCARTVLGRTARTAIGLAGAVLLVEILAPMPGEADGVADLLDEALVVLFCLVVLTAVAAVVAGGLYLVHRLCLAALRAWRGPDDGRTRDLGSLAAVIALLGLASVEGLPWAYALDGGGRATASRHVAAPPEAVWAAMETATSPARPLPALLRSLPRPVAVPTDEGTALGARRVVRFAGREGSGALSLRVTERTDALARLAVLSDTSPIANWVALRAITYEVAPEAGGARLQVTLEYEALLSPTWVFAPMVGAAAHLAMDVLARDTAERSERRLRPPERTAETRGQR